MVRNGAWAVGSRHLSKALASPELKNVLRQDGAVEADRTREEFRKFLAE